MNRSLKFCNGEGGDLHTSLAYSYCLPRTSSGCTSMFTTKLSALMPAGKIQKTHKIMTNYQSVAVNNCLMFTRTKDKINFLKTV